MTTKERILETALDLFLNHGVDGTGIERILRDSQTSRGGLYHHFKDKQALYEAVLAHYFLGPFKELDVDAFAQLPMQDQQLLLVALFKNMPNLIDTITPHGASRYFAFFFDSLTRSEIFGDSVRKYYRGLLHAMQTAITREAPHVMADKTARAFLARLEGEIYLCGVLGGPPDFSRLENEILKGN